MDFNVRLLQQPYVKFCVCHLNLAILTILAVVGDLHFALLGPQQCLGHLGHSVPTGELAMQEVTSAWLLHYIWPGKARHLAETIITVDNSAVLHPGIGYDEFLICDEAEKKLGEKECYRVYRCNFKLFAHK